jgi:hypothetical protein
MGMAIAWFYAENTDAFGLVFLILLGGFLGVTMAVMVAAAVPTVVRKGWPALHEALPGMKWAIERWHPGQLVLLWMVAAALEFLLLRAFDGDVAGPFTLLIDRASDLFGSQTQAGSIDMSFIHRYSSADQLLWMLQIPLAVIYTCVPVAMFFVSWIWFGSRQR